MQEIIINGQDLATIANATQAAIAACKNVDGLQRISAGNYNGKLGKSFIYLDPDTAGVIVQGPPIDAKPHAVRSLFNLFWGGLRISQISPTIPRPRST